MFETLQEIWFYILIPPLAIILGGLVAIFYTPRPLVESGIQHFAAGMIFAAVAGELLPQLHDALPTVVIGGFTIGVLVMLFSKTITEEKWGVKIGHSKGGSPAGAASLLAASGVNFVVDGFLLGVGFSVGTEEGILLMIAVAIENLFLGLASVVALDGMGASVATRVASALGLAVLFALPALAGVTLLAGLSGSALALVVSFGAAALLYLVTEELLVEKHEEVAESPVTTALFFLGFLLLLVIEMITKGTHS